MFLIEMFCMYLVNISFLSESTGAHTSVLFFGDKQDGSISEILQERSMANET